MKEKFKNKYIAWGTTAFCVLAAMLVLYFLISKWRFLVMILKKIVNILMPFIFGLVIAYLLNPAVNFFDNKIFSKLFPKTNKKNKKTIRILSLATATIIFIGILVASICLLLPGIVRSIDMLINNINVYLNDSKQFVTSFVESESVKQAITAGYNSLSKNVEKWLTAESIENIIVMVRDGIFTTLKFIYNLVIGYIISIYILFDKEKFKAQAKKILYSFLSKEHANLVIENIRYTDRVFADFFSAKIIDSAIVGIICFIFMFVFRMPYPLMVSVIIGVTNVIPYFGPFIGAIPAAALILLVDPVSCIPFLIFIFVLQQFDGSILGPKILGSKTGLSSFWVLFSLLIFGGLFGVIGMIIGVPIFSIVYTSINNLLKKRLEERKLPLDSKDYENVIGFNKKTGKPIYNK